MARENLWAPWRLEYILSNKPEARETHECPFCLMPALELSSETLVLYKDDDIFVIMNRFPYNPGALLICPRKHVERPEDLDPGIWLKLSRAMELCLETLEQALKPGGFNCGINLGRIAGAGIAEHMHWHIVPRWAGDTNFMPIIAEIKAIPAHLKTSYDQLRPLFDGFSERLSAVKVKT